MQETGNPRTLRERAAALFRRKNTEDTASGRHRGRKLAAVVVVLAVLAAAFLPRLGAGGGENTVSPLDVMTLSSTDLRRTVSATGTVESAQSVLVYSTQSYAVQEVLVEVGDYVEAGQLMAKLDDGVILDQIESQEAALSASNSASSAAIAAAEHNYEQYKAALDAGLNSSILNAESLDEGENSTILAQESALEGAERSLSAAEDAYDSAQDAYDDARAQAEEAQTSYGKAQAEVEQAKQKLDEAKEKVSILTEQVNTGEATKDQLDAAVVEQNTAQQTFDQAKNEETQASLTLALRQVARDSAQSQASAAERTLEEAEAAYDTAQTQYRAALNSADDALEDCADAVDTAYEAYLDAQVTLENTQADAQETLADYADRLNTAYAAYGSAQAGLESTENAAQNQLQSYQDSLNSAYANASTSTGEVSLRQLRADLEGTEITAPAAGTVTAVYAEVGSSGAGLLFVIEDVDNLVVATSVKDYDVASVSTGMAVAIQSDSTGDQVYDGEVTSIAPTAAKNAAGETDTSGDISFATDVAVTSQDTGLRIGMSVELDFVLDEALNALSVPYDAVYENDQGQTCLLVLEEGEDGELLLTELPVTTGLENDLDIAVEGDGLTEGVQVVTDPDRYLPLAGQEVALGTEGAA